MHIGAMQFRKKKKKKKKKSKKKKAPVEQLGANGPSKRICQGRLVRRHYLIVLEFKSNYLTTG